MSDDIAEEIFAFGGSPFIGGIEDNEINGAYESSDINGAYESSEIMGGGRVGGNDENLEIGGDELGGDELKKIEIISVPEHKIPEIVNEIFNKPTECSFKSGNKDICSTKELTEKMSKFIEVKKGKVVKKPDEVIENMKTLLDCNSESCIYKKKEFVEFAKLNNVDKILDELFKPEGPATNFGLLSNVNIDEVLDQFVERFAHKKFLHIPFQMIDFEKKRTLLSTINLPEKLKHQYDTFGVVLNTDVTEGRGIHWFCLFGEKYKSKSGHTVLSLEYFNSSGRPPMTEVQRWINTKAHELRLKLNLPVKLHYTNNIYFQNDEHSCGVYALAYIWLRLEGIPPTWFNADNFNDVMMHKLRQNLFTPDKISKGQDD